MANFDPLSAAQKVEAEAASVVSRGYSFKVLLFSILGAFLIGALVGHFG